MRRRQFLTDTGMGFTGLALGSMMAAQAPAPQAKAKRVIWLFMVGGVSHMESFDPKPELNKYAGRLLGDTPHAAALESPLVKQNLRELIAGLHKAQPRLYPLQTGFQKRGQSGIEVSDWFPHVGSCIDDIAVVRSLWTTDNNHGAQMQFHTGRHVLEGQLPTIGSWVHYGLGSLNENLPQFVVLGDPIDTCCGGPGAHGAGYLGPQHGGVRLDVKPESPLSYAKSYTATTAAEQRRQFDLIRDFNRLAQIEYPDDPALKARIQSYELAFRMQTAVPEVMQLGVESEATRKLYGLDHEVTKPFGETLLAARRLAESGVRFIQVFHGSTGGAGKWDAHSNLKKTHGELCAQVDQPIAGLLKDLKQRGLLEDTLVVFATEFGRTPGAEGTNGRDHHPYGFSAWLAGGGIKGGVAHGATDEIGFHAVEHRHYVTDIHATILHQLGIDPRKLEVPGHKRIDLDYGEPIHAILA
ncbi:MAG: DUF1501 domain-containing protein [Bryobacteraceae bacterium]|nr:DUF1501 domain-containing protein [Bryobacteraceae bacterium]